MPTGVAAPAAAHDEPTTTACPSCGSQRLETFHEQSSVPVHSCRLVATREEALSFPRGRLRLALCRDCGFITNEAYDPSLQDYGIAYEETQGFSATFREFSRALASRWIERYDLRDKTILEIGCGKGEFLASLCELGPNRGIGIDPAFDEERFTSPAADRISFIQDLFHERHVGLEADAIVCRHTLEHIGDVATFMSSVARTAQRRPGCVVLFDLPDVVRVLRETAFWDIYYEHCSYFSPGSLARLFRRSGLRVLSLDRDFDDQYLVIEALPGDDGSRAVQLEERPGELADLVADFARRVTRTTESWRAFLADVHAHGRRAVLWGAGSKAVAFLTTLGIGDEVAYAVDINPYKQGKFLAGTGHRVVGPSHVGLEPADVVVVMNPSYVDEIRATLDGVGVPNAELVALQGEP